MESKRFFFVAQLIPNMAFVATLRFEGVEMIQKTWMDGFFRTPLRVQCVLVGSDNLATKGTFTNHIL